jgi:RNA polymerase sigma-70 factor (ECF subfamily)
VEGELASGGQPEELDAAYERHFADLARLCRALGAGPDSEDLAQEVMIFARAHVGDVRDPAKLEGWLRAIAVRKTYRLKSRRTSAQLGGEEMIAPLDTDLPIDLAAALARLPARERAVLTLVHGLGYSQADAAEALGIRRGTVAATLSHARAKLATWLIDYERGR